MPFIRSLLEQIHDLFGLKSSLGHTAEITVVNCIVALLAALVLGLAISLTYAKTTEPQNLSRGFPLTLALLPAIISIIVLLAGSSVARAFSLAGAFALVRFRSVPGEPKDIAYVCMTMAVGLAVGMGFVDLAIVFALILCAAAIVFTLCGFDRPAHGIQRLRITVPENMPFENAFDDVFRQFDIPFTLDKVQLSNLGSLFELHYTLRMPKNIKQQELIDELRLHNGNLNISIQYSPLKNK